uniref:Uncharacterized protein n=1 Tax=Zea mays TaxID=4577 RepID=A0A804MA38_MAIZE
MLLFEDLSYLRAEGSHIANHQLLMLEAKLFLGAFSSYDRHRDMQMDIDNMSYEAQNICNLVFDKSSKICLGGKLQQICAMFYSDFGVFCLTEAKRNHQAVLFLLALDVRAMNKHVDIEPNDAREVWSTHEPVHINPSDPSSSSCAHIICHAWYRGNTTASSWR